MDGLEAVAGLVEGLEGRLGVAVYFCFLAALTLPDPLADLALHVGPEIALGQELESGFDAGVGEVVEAVVDGATAGGREEWSGFCR